MSHAILERMVQKHSYFDDQRNVWNEKHALHEHAALKNSHNAQALDLVSALTPCAEILELGCGMGADARFFAKQGMRVLATDISDIVIRENQLTNSLGHLKFEVLDSSQTMPYNDNRFDAVYAHLSLHYFSDAKTRAIFHEIARILRPKGVLYFTCRSTKDPLYDQGAMLEQDVFCVKSIFVISSKKIMS